MPTCTKRNCRDQAYKIRLCKEHYRKVMFRWKKETEQANKQEKQILERENITYSQYLKSPYWMSRRSRWNKQDRNKKCWVCGSSELLNVHHRRYRKNGSIVTGKQKLIS